MDYMDAPSFEGVGQPVWNTAETKFGEKNKWQALTWYWWDRVTYPAAGTRELTFFTVPVGGSLGAGATKQGNLTNMTQSGELGYGSAFDISGIGVQLVDTGAVEIVSAELRALMAAGWLEFKLSEMPVIQGPVAAFPYGGGATVQAGTPAAGLVQIAQNGVPSYEAARTWPTSQRIPRQVSFKATIEFPPAPAITNPIDILVELRGILWVAKRGTN